MNETGIPSVDRHGEGAEEDPVEGGSAASSLGAPLPDPDEEPPTHPTHRSDPERPAGPMDPSDPDRPAGPMDPSEPGEPTPAGPMP
jgi:nucleoid-associated protein YgaU